VNGSKACLFVVFGLHDHHPLLLLCDVYPCRTSLLLLRGQKRHTAMDYADIMEHLNER